MVASIHKIQRRVQQILSLLSSTAHKWKRNSRACLFVDKRQFEGVYSDFDGTVLLVPVQPGAFDGLRSEYGALKEKGENYITEYQTTFKLQFW